jgi:hypothetical protein
LDASTKGWQQLESLDSISGPEAQSVLDGMKLLNTPEKDGTPGV